MKIKVSRNMRNMKQQICRRIMEATLGLFILCGQCMLQANAQTTSYTKAEFFLFSFKEGSDMFLADYGDNAYQLERMGQQLPVFVIACWVEIVIC